MTRAGIYVRLSQDREGLALGVQRQEEDCLELCERRGWDTAVYRDNDVTASGRKVRPEWARMLADIGAGRLDAVVAYSSSRLYRHARDLQAFIEVVESRGVAVATVVSGELDLTTADGRMIARLLAAADQREWEATSERWRRQKRAAIADGKYTGGEKEPFGYRRETDKHLVVEPHEAAALKDAVARLSRGDSLTSVVREWNATGARTSKGARWQPTTLRRTLLSDHLTGARGYPRVLTDEEAVIVRSLIKTEERRPGPPPGRKAPLAGLLVCSLCGTKLTTNGQAYRCSVSHGGCGGVSIRMHPLERFVLVECLRRWFATDGQPVRDSASSAETAPLVDELRELEVRAEAIAAGLADGALTVRLAADAQRRVDRRRDELTEELARSLPAPSTEPIVHTLTDIFSPYEMAEAGIVLPDGVMVWTDAREEFAALWEARDPEAVAQVRTLYDQVLERVVISPRQQRGRGFDATRVVLSWR